MKAWVIKNSKGQYLSGFFGNDIYGKLKIATLYPTCESAKQYACIDETVVKVNIEEVK